MLSDVIAEVVGRDAQESSRFLGTASRSSERLAYELAFETAQETSKMQLGHLAVQSLSVGLRTGEPLLQPVTLTDAFEGRCQRLIS